MADDTENEDAGSGQPQAAPAAQSQQPFSIGGGLYNWLVNERNVRPDVAYGAIGSLMGESGRRLNPGSRNPGDGSDGSDSLGVGQWNGVRGQNLRSTASGMNMQWSDGQANLEHIKNELDGKYAQGNYGHVLAGLQAGNSVADGNNIWTTKYEIPANANDRAAERLKFGQGLKDAAAAGTLDWSKLGSMQPSQNMTDPRSFQANAAPSQDAGALGANNIAGGNPGALYGGEQSTSPSIGQRMLGVAASLASISNPSQAAALNAQLVQMQGKQKDPLNDLYKRTLIAATMKKINTPDSDPNALTFQRLAPDGKTPIYTNAAGLVVGGDGKPMATVPEAPEAPPNANDMKPLEMTNYTKYQAGAQNNASTLDTALELQHRLAANPDIARYLGFAQDGKTLIANGMGESTPAGQFVKDVNAAQSKGVIDIVSNVGAKAQNIKFQQLEKDAIAPNGSLQDPETLYGVLGRIGDSSRRGYMTNMTGLQTYEKKYGPSLTYLDPDGNLTTPSAVHASNLERWQKQQAVNQQAYATILHPNHDIAAGVTKAPTLTERLQSAFPQPPTQ